MEKIKEFRVILFFVGLLGLIALLNIYIDNAEERYLNTKTIYVMPSGKKMDCKQQETRITCNLIPKE